MQRVRRPTLADVARLAGTSSAVVSYVVNGGPRPVARSTRDKVEAAIAELGYRRDPVARALSGGRSQLIGLIVPDSSNAFFSELEVNVESVARARKLLVLLGNTEYDPRIEQDYAEAFADMRVAGTLVVTISVEQTPSSIPHVHLHSRSQFSLCSNVTFDDDLGVELAVEHLRAHGHNDIHCVTGPERYGPTAQRAAIWERITIAAGLDADIRRHRVSFDRLNAEDALFRWIAKDPPRAVFATTDEHALAMVRAAARAGLKIPDDIAVIGFDGIREGLLGGVRLTTVAVPFRAMASAGLDLVDDAVAGKPPRDVVLPVYLVLGDTCGCTPDIARPSRAPTAKVNRLS